MKKIFTTLCFVFLVVFVATTSVKAEVLEPAGKDGNDRRNIQSELDTNKKVKLKKGGKYYLDSHLILDDGYSIDATGATIYCSGELFLHNITATGYKSLKNVTVKGGTWKSTIKTGCTHSTIKLVHAKNIKLINMKISLANIESHTIEIVASKDVLIENCKITPLGKSKSTSVEEPLQIDIAAPHTAPFVNSKYLNGATCKNITIRACTVKGCRGICANYPPNDRQYINNFHENIVIEDCKITSTTSQALSLFNTKSAKIKNTTIICNAPSSRGYYAGGMHVAYFGKAPSKLSDANFTITGNTIKGTNFGLKVASKYGTVTIKNNACYSKKGAGAALSVTGQTKLVKEKNKTEAWK